MVLRRSTDANHSFQGFCGEYLDAYTSVTIIFRPLHLSSKDCSSPDSQVPSHFSVELMIPEQRILLRNYRRALASSSRDFRRISSVKLVRTQAVGMMECPVASLKVHLITERAWMVSVTVSDSRWSTYLDLTFHAKLLPAIPASSSEVGKRRPPIAASLTLTWLNPERNRCSYAFLRRIHLQW